METLVYKNLKYDFRSKKFRVGHLYFHDKRIGGYVFKGSEKYSANGELLAFVRFWGFSGQRWTGEQWVFDYIEKDSTPFFIMIYNRRTGEFFHSDIPFPPIYIKEISEDAISFFNPLEPTIAVKTIAFEALNLRPRGYYDAFCISITAPEFLNDVKKALAEQGEILVEIRPPYCAGSYDSEIHTDFEIFQKRISKLSIMVWVRVIRDFYLPIRGVVDAKFIEEASAYIAENEEYVLFQDGLSTVEEFEKHCFETGDIRQELLADLNKYLGKKVVLGKMKDTYGKIYMDGFVPLSNGEVVLGAY